MKIMQSNVFVLEENCTYDISTFGDRKLDQVHCKEGELALQAKLLNIKDQYEKQVPGCNNSTVEKCM